MTELKVDVYPSAFEQPFPNTALLKPDETVTKIRFVPCFTVPPGTRRISTNIEEQEDDVVRGVGLQHTSPQQNLSLSRHYYCITTHILGVLKQHVLHPFRAPKLEEVVVEEGIHEIGDNFMSDCRTLKTVVLPESSLTTIGNRFLRGCSSLFNLNVPDSLTSIGGEFLNSCVSFPFSSSSSSSIFVLPPGLTHIGDNFLAHCQQLKALNAEKCVEICSLSTGFLANCSSLVSVALPPHLINIGDSVLCDCRSLTSIEGFSNNTTLRALGHSFLRQCMAVKELRFPRGIVFIGPNGLANCSRLRSITFPHDSVLTRINRGFASGCTSLESIVRLPQSITSIGDDFLIGCAALTSVDLPESLTELGGEGFLFGCANLVTLDLPEGLKSLTGGAANPPPPRGFLAHCDSLREIRVASWLLDDVSRLQEKEEKKNGSHEQEEEDGDESSEEDDSTEDDKKEEESAAAAGRGALARALLMGTTGYRVVEHYVDQK